MGRPFIEKRHDDIAGGKHEKRQRAGNPSIFWRCGRELCLGVWRFLEKHCIQLRLKVRQHNKGDHRWLTRSRALADCGESLCAVGSCVNCSPLPHHSHPAERRMCSCDLGYFPCGNTTKCLPQQLQCNGVTDWQKRTMDNHGWSKPQVTAGRQLDLSSPGRNQGQKWASIKLLRLLK